MNLVQLLDAYTYALASATAYKSDDAVIRHDMDQIGSDFIEYHKVEFGNHFGLYCRFEDHVVITFRGTDTATDWRDNLDVKKKIVHMSWTPHQIKVHEGFFNAAWEFYARMVHLLNEDKEKNKPVYICGHSLGAGIANCFTALCVDEVKVIGLYTYGSPRTFGYKASKLFDKRMDDRHYRFVHTNDPVPGVPMRLMNYRHSGQRVYIDRRNEPSMDTSLQYRIWDRFRCQGNPVHNHHFSTYVRHLGYAYMKRKEELGFNKNNEKANYSHNNKQ